MSFMKAVLLRFVLRFQMEMLHQEVEEKMEIMLTHIVQSTIAAAAHITTREAQSSDHFLVGKLIVDIAKSVLNTDLVRPNILEFVAIVGVLFNSITVRETSTLKEYLSSLDKLAPRLRSTNIPFPELQGHILISHLTISQSSFFFLLPSGYKNTRASNRREFRLCICYDEQAAASPPDAGRALSPQK
ncbi:hypothetical protein DAPPUDRAFT_249532 [Daphnia pulex]|uniref:Uncharacterized protein n=1 Tax=Daphnia pulex TaxID=6669 RepID=E9GWU8_DAPPU|nr:hypothetical protein DAPPUDRAFT_249532 [Daphnia pulex]|eukprot:EFX76059.1 hypothetical protein DAPPUDRAFT_249532 [Daphnia pulex]